LVVSSALRGAGWPFPVLRGWRKVRARRPTGQVRDLADELRRPPHTVLSSSCEPSLNKVLLQVDELLVKLLASRSDLFRALTVFKESREVVELAADGLDSIDHAGHRLEILAKLEQHLVLHQDVCLAAA